MLSASSMKQNAESLENKPCLKRKKAVSVYNSIKRRSVTNNLSFGRFVNVSARLLLPMFKSPSNLVYQFIFPDSEFCTPFYCDFSHHAQDGNLLAVGDEEGRLSLLRTDKDNGFNNIDYHHSFYCHKHAISDVKWSLDDTMLVTASHDRVIRLWDTETRSSLAEFAGHSDVVKSVNWHPTNEHLVVTGSKDGSYRIWDTRYKQLPAEDPNDISRIPVYDSVRVTPEAHNDEKISAKKVTKKPSGFTPLTIRSVTCALFVNDDEDKVISSGSVDGSIKLWDIRAGRLAREIESTVFKSEKTGRKYGITDMKIDSSRKRLFSSCMDNSVYMHYLTNLSKPAKRFVDPDYKVGSFDIKISLSPDDQFLLSGSHDKDLFVWQVERPHEAARRFEGHTKKTTGVAWSKTTLNQFASCSEDFTTRIWNASNGNDDFE